MDPIALSIGAAVAKWVLRLWTNDSSLGELGGNFVDILPGAIVESRQRRIAGRQFDRLAEEVSDRISPFLSGEVTGVDEGELRAASDGVQRALSSPIMNLPSMIAIDLNSAALSKLLLENDKEAVRLQYLSEGAYAAYELILTESVGYAVAIASRLPDFNTAVFSELLSRESTLIDLAKKVLEDQPESMVPNTWGRGSAHQRFETQYRRAIFEHADRLQLFGVNSPMARSTYSLSVAYIPLQVFTQPGEAGSEEKRLTSETSAEAVRIEKALKGKSRILISGGAGIGKTTLIQWLTIATARNRFSDELSDWNGGVPFIVQLRRFHDRPFPRPEEFMDLTTPSISGAAPPGWVHQVLEDGRALVLVDGFDEVTSERRDEALDWLRDLTDVFPENKYVVTSRDHAIDESWRSEMNYSRAALLPMEYSDIQEFVSHWHEAALGSTPSDLLRSELNLAQKTVLAQIRDKAAIRNLCNSPLLCALICALNHEGGARLPENRMEVYDAALQMLVVKRDRDRQVDIAPGLNLNFTEAKLLLRWFAYWMQENRATDASDVDFRQVIADQLPRLHHLNADVDIVARHLLARSGVLREPIVGRIDFVHRTFLEYLAAEAIVSMNQIDKLISVGHDDYWREVIILAAGHAQLTDRERLIRGLISRGDVEPDYRHVLYLLALSCMETSPELTPKVQADLAKCLRSVIPPANMTDAAAIAAAGDLAVPLLAMPPKHAVTAAASIRALSLIGGEGALAALKKYRGDSRLTVIRQLTRAWGAFDQRKYAEEILSHSPLEQGFISVSDTEQIRLLGLLPRLQRARVEVSQRSTTLDAIPRIPQIIAVIANRLDRLESLGDLAGLTGVMNLSLLDAIKLRSLEGIQELPSLRFLDIDGCIMISDLGPISTLNSLTNLDIAGTSVTDLAVLEPLTNLESLRVAGCLSLRSLGSQIKSRTLSVTFCPALEDVSGISSSTVLESLIYEPLSNGVKLTLPASLRDLTILGNGKESNTSFDGADDLENLTLRFVGKDSDWTSFAMSKQKLGYLNTQWTITPTPARMHALSEHPSLKTMRFATASSEELKAYGELDGWSRRLRGRSLVYTRDE